MDPHANVVGNELELHYLPHSAKQLIGTTLDYIKNVVSHYISIALLEVGTTIARRNSTDFVISGNFLLLRMAQIVETYKICDILIDIS